MITHITKKELKRIISLRKLTSHKNDGIMVWIAPDRKAYKCDTPGMAGVKERTAWDKKLKEQLTAQNSLL